MKHSIISFTCDGPHCEASTLCPDAHMFTPENWYSVELPTDDVFIGDALHFCSLVCLSMWATVEVEACHPPTM